MLTQKDIIYFIMTDRFCDGDEKNNFNVDKSNAQAWHGGDFAGIIKKIPYLKNLGITVLWITPVYHSIKRGINAHEGYHGYWPLDFDRVDPHLYSHEEGIEPGSRIYLKKLTDILHNNGIKLILDMVVNHTGYNHPWLKERPHWFNPPGYEDDIRRYIYGLPDLDLSKPDPTDYLVNNIIQWVRECGVDGIRMDSVKHVDRSFWYHLKASLRGACPHISIFGEAFYYDPGEVSHYQNYYDFDSMLDFPLKQAFYEVFVEEQSFLKIARRRISHNEPPGTLDMDLKYNNPYRLVTFLDNHDFPRFITQLFRRFGYDGDGRFWSVNAYKTAMTFLFTCRGIPQLYYGDEIGMEGWVDPHNRQDMPWDIFDRNEPHRDKYPQSGEIFAHTKKLIAIRKANPSLEYGSLITLWVDDFVMVFLRYVEDNVVIAGFNNGRYPMTAPIKIPFKENSNIPSRIKDIISRNKYHNKIPSQITPTNYLRIPGDYLEVQIQGKRGEIFVVNPQNG